MKIRMIYPFVNIFACIMVILMGWGFTRSTVTFNENILEYTIHPVGVIAWLLLIIFILSVAIIVNRYNKKHPEKKINAFSIKPPEYNEEDEMYQLATMRATKKVYTFITFALPITLAILIFPFPFSKFSIFLMIGCIIIIQNLIFYFEMRKYQKAE